MEAFGAWILANPATALLIFGTIVDIIRGALPNNWKYCQDAGITLTFLKKLADLGQAELEKQKKQNTGFAKVGVLLFIGVCFLLSSSFLIGCAVQSGNISQDQQAIDQQKIREKQLQLGAKVFARHAGIGLAKILIQKEKMSALNAIIDSLQDIKQGDLVTKNIADILTGVLPYIKEDPALEADMRDVIALLSIDDNEQVEQYKEIIQVSLVALKEGLLSEKNKL